MTPDLVAAPAPTAAALVRRIRSVPDTLRRFTVPPTATRRTYGIDDALLRDLLAAGLPSAGHGDDRRFDDYDLANVALHLGLMSVQRMSMRAWSAGLRRHSAAAWTPLVVDVVAECPVPPHPGPCPVGLLRAGGSRERLWHRTPGEPLARYDVVLRGEWPELGPAATELVHETADVDFFMLPEAIRWDAGFAAATGMSDCGRAAARLVDEGTRRGLRVRFCFGLIAVRPFSTPHCWAEFDVDGTWTPVDPLLITMLRTWAGLRAEDWPLHRSIGPITHRLCGHFTKVASHDGLWMPVSLSTRAHPSPDGEPVAEPGRSRP